MASEVIVMYPFGGSQKGARGSRGGCASNRSNMRSFRALTDSLGLTYENSGITSRVLARLCARPGPSELDFEGSWPLSGPVLEAETWYFRMIQPARSKPTHLGGKHSKNCGFRSTRRSENRCERASDKLWRRNTARNAHRSGWRAVRAPFWTLPGSSWVARGRSWAVPGASRSALGRSWACPSPSLERL